MVGQYSISEGTDVYGSDGEKVGSVVAVQPNYVVVEKGFFFPTDYYIPTSAVASAEEGRVYLSVTKDAALNQGWDTEPTGGYAADMGATTTAGTYDTATTTGMGAATTVGAYDADVTTATTTGAYDTGAAATTVDTAAVGTAPMDVAATPTRQTSTGTAALDEVDNPFEHYEDTDRTHVDATDGIVVPVHEEELSATTRQREIGEVEIQKEVVSEQRTVEVPVTEERVRVERHAVDRTATPDETAFQEGTIEVPIRGEEVQLQKTVRVAEEVEIGKEAVQRTEQVAGTVRREEVRVEEVGEAGTGRKRKRSS